jgi:nickel-dependent lactate racemase
MKIRLPYGRGTLEGTIPDRRVAGVIQGHLDDYRPEASEWELVADSLRHPIGSKPLRELAQGKKTVVLIASDHTRPVPSKIIVPQMLDEIRAGNPQAEVTILIATGCHRGTTKQELEEKFGAELVQREHIVIHDCWKAEELVELGTLPGGGALVINRLAAQADLLVSEGFIEPHFFAGFSGGRKSVLPGIASQKTVYANHCARFIDSPKARSGILEGNPIHRDMIFAARRAGLAFIVNVVINSRHEVIASFAGDCEQAHLAGAKFLSGLCCAPAIPADIVVTTNNGYPLDQNIYQAVKGMCTAEATVRPGGVIIMAAACADGSGGESFLRTFAEDRSATHILEQIRKVPPDKTVADQWQSQIFARILSQHQVILISQAPQDMVRALHMVPASSIEEALALADQMLGREGTITVIPEGISCIIR